MIFCRIYILLTIYTVSGIVMFTLILLSVWG